MVGEVLGTVLGSLASIHIFNRNTKRTWFGERCGDIFGRTVWVRELLAGSPEYFLEFCRCGGLKRNSTSAN